MQKQIVISHYEKPLGWAESLANQGWNVLCYTKGHGSPTLPSVRLANVGWDGYCYLSHIIERWEELAEDTLFCQDDPTEHIPAGVRPDSLFDGPPSPWKGFHWTGREWDDQGRLVLPEPWAAKWRDGRMRRATQTLAEWFFEWFGADLMQMSAITYVPGANFVASRQALQARPRGLYRALRERLGDAVEPEECHYLERSWLYLLDDGVTVRWPPTH